MTKLNEGMEAGTDAAIPTNAQVNHVSQTIAKPNVKCSAIVTDAKLTEAWGNANFGNVSKHDVIIGTLKKVAQAWGTGHTAMCIVKELGLVESRNNQIGLSDKGLMYLLASVEC